MVNAAIIARLAREFPNPLTTVVVGSILVGIDILNYMRSGANKREIEKLRTDLAAELKEIHADLKEICADVKEVHNDLKKRDHG
ncbi:hypothetical protein RUND412_009661 [Rhizina undulata]